MKLICLFLLFSTSAMAISIAPSISGKVLATEGCSKSVMVWLSLDKDNYQERLLLMHTQVPQGGSFEFFVKPGEYQVRASDELGCEYLKKVHIKNESSKLEIKMVKK